MKIIIHSGQTDVDDTDINLDAIDISEFVELLRKCDYIFDEDGSNYSMTSFSYDFSQNHFDVNLDKVG